MISCFFHENLGPDFDKYKKNSAPESPEPTAPSEIAELRPAEETPSAQTSWRPGTAFFRVHKRLHLALLEPDLAALLARHRCLNTGPDRWAWMRARGCACAVACKFVRNQCS